MDIVDGNDADSENENDRVSEMTPTTHNASDTEKDRKESIEEKGDDAATDKSNSNDTEENNNEKEESGDAASDEGVPKRRKSSRRIRKAPKWLDEEQYVKPTREKKKRGSGGRGRGKGRGSGRGRGRSRGRGRGKRRGRGRGRGRRSKASDGTLSDGDLSDSSTSSEEVSSKKGWKKKTKKNSGGARSEGRAEAVVRIIRHDAPKWVRILSNIGSMPAGQGNLIKMIVERAIESVDDEVRNGVIVDALRLAISPRVFNEKSAGTCKRMVLHIVAQFGGMPGAPMDDLVSKSRKAFEKIKKKVESSRDPQVPTWTLGKTFYPAYPFRHKECTRVVIRDGKLARLDGNDVQKKSEAEDSKTGANVTDAVAEKNAHSSNVASPNHRVLPLAARFLKKHESRVLPSGEWQPTLPGKVRLLYRYTFADIESVGTGLSTFRFTDVPGLERVRMTPGERMSMKTNNVEDKSVSEDGTPDSKKRLRTLEEMGELMHCVDLVGRYQRRKYHNMYEDPFVKVGLPELTWEEWTTRECVWNFRDPTSERDAAKRRKQAKKIEEERRKCIEKREKLKKQIEEAAVPLRKSKRKRSSRNKYDVNASKNGDGDDDDEGVDVIERCREAAKAIDGTIRDGVRARGIPAFFWNDTNRLNGAYAFRKRKKKRGLSAEYRKRRRRKKKKKYGRGGASDGNSSDGSEGGLRIKKPAMIMCPYPGCSRKCAGLVALRRHLQVHKEERMKAKQRRWEVARLESHVVNSPRKDPRESETNSGDREHEDVEDDEDEDEDAEDENEEDEDEEDDDEDAPVAKRAKRSTRVETLSRRGSKKRSRPLTKGGEDDDDDDDDDDEEDSNAPSRKKANIIRITRSSFKAGFFD